MKETSSGWY